MINSGTTVWARRHCHNRGTTEGVAFCLACHLVHGTHEGAHGGDRQGGERLPRPSRPRLATPLGEGREGGGHEEGVPFEGVHHRVHHLVHLTHHRAMAPEEGVFVEVAH